MSNNSVSYPLTAASIVLRLTAIPILFFIAQQLAHFPVFSTIIASGLALYVVGLMFWSKLWLIVLPGLLPVLDLTPWSGHILTTEFDLFVLSSIAISLLCNRVDFTFIRQIGVAKWLVFLLIFSFGISTFIGFTSMKSVSSSPFNLYLTQFNSLRVAKGFFAALFFLPILAYEKKQGTPIAKLLSLGIIVGFVLTLSSIIWERTVLPGFFDFSNTYRISGLFSGLLLGGEMLDGYLFLAFPFFIVLILSFNNVWVRLLGVLVFTGGLYGILVTFTRTDYLALLVVISILLLGSLKIQKRIIKRNIWFYIIFVVLGLFVSLNIFKGGFIGQRFSTSRESFDQRLNHWESVLNIGKPEILSLIFGNGKGSYPYHYFNDDLAGISSARFWLMQDNTAGEHNTLLRFSPSDIEGTLKVIQRFPVNQTGSYRVKITLRTPSKHPQKLLVEFCQENILSFPKDCPWLGFSLDKNKPNQWQTITQFFVSDPLIKPLFSTITPVGIYLLNRGLTESVDIRQIEVFDPTGVQLLKNNTFTQDFDHWIFSTGNFLGWHTDNLWVSALFEGGLIEFCLLSILLIYLARHLFKLAWQGNVYALAMFAAIIGTIIIGLFGDIFDDPRVSWLFYVIVWVAILKPEMQPNLHGKRMELLPWLIPVAVILLMVSGVAAFTIKKLGYSTKDVVSVFTTKAETKLNLAYTQTYQAKLGFPDIYQWRGQGANTSYSPIISRYAATGQPLTMADHPEKTTFSRTIPVRNTAELLQALKNALPGDGIELQAGIYSINQSLDIQKTGSVGTPIVVYAQRLGNVLIEFNSREGFTLNAPYWTFQNLIIKGDCENHNDCDHAFHITGQADGVILRNNIIVDFNAAIKGNGSPESDKSIVYPDNVLVEKNTISNTSARKTQNAVTPIDVVGGNHWHIKANFISDFIKAQGNKTAYGAFLKGYGKQGIFEENLVMCNKNIYLPGHEQVGLSFGGGGTGSQFCFDQKCQYEHDQGIMQNNIIMNCNDVGIYLNKSKNTQVINNILYNTAGVDIRFPESSATVSNNLLTGKIKSRNNAALIEKDNMQGIEKTHFTRWFTQPDKADFSLIQLTSKPLPNLAHQTTHDYCMQPISQKTRNIGAIEATIQEDCKNLLNHSLPPLTLAFDAAAHEVIKQQEKRLQRDKAEALLKMTIKVCQIGCESQDLTKALKAVKTNGIIYMEAGQYQTCGYINRSVHIIGSPLLKNGTHLTQTACNGKAALIVNAPNVTLENLEISHVSVKDKDGACLRIETNASDLTLNRLNCHDNQAGVIANIAKGKLTIKNSIFEHNGFNNGKVNNLSIHTQGSVEIAHSKILDTTNKGHALQIDTPHFLMDHSEIAGLTGQNSRAIDNATGGEMIITNSTLQQSPNSDNHEIIAFALGDPKTLQDRQIVTLENTQIIFDKQPNLFSRLLNSRKLFKAPDSTEVFLNNNTIVGMDSFGATHVNASGNKQYTSREEAGIAPHEQ